MITAFRQGVPFSPLELSIINGLLPVGIVELCGVCSPDCVFGTHSTSSGRPLIPAPVRSSDEGLRGTAAPESSPAPRCQRLLPRPCDPAYTHEGTRPFLTHVPQGRAESQRFLALLHGSQALADRCRSSGRTRGRGITEAGTGGGAVSVPDVAVAARRGVEVLDRFVFEG